ncbi:MAG: helix-turn-helix transcriptional regulator [Alphaproteobacteria bacterium]|nr:helix-turn-helix transcriptional regulator [Alphaproteobacteria bacterium]
MANIEEIRKKIDQLITQKGFNYRDASLKIGRKDSYLQQYVKYGYPRRLKEIDRMRLAKLLGVDDSEIMDDEIIASKTTGAVNSNLDVISDIIRASQTPENDMVSIDIVSNTFSDSKKQFLENTVGQHILSKSFLGDVEDIKNIKIVKITNDIMSPSVNTGDLVWFDCSYTYPEADGLYLMHMGRNLYINRIQTSPVNGETEISSDNPQYKSYQTDNKNSIEVLGKVLFIFHRL